MAETHGRDVPHRDTVLPSYLPLQNRDLGYYDYWTAIYVLTTEYTYTRAATPSGITSIDFKLRVLMTSGKPRRKFDSTCGRKGGYRSRSNTNNTNHPSFHDSHSIMIVTNIENFTAPRSSVKSIYVSLLTHRPYVLRYFSHGKIEAHQ
jgi:hypothetical protein